MSAFLAGIIAIPGKPRFPGRLHQAPRGRRLTLRLVFRIGMQADPDRGALFDPLITPRHPPDEIKRAPTPGDIHGSAPQNVQQIV